MFIETSELADNAQPQGNGDILSDTVEVAQAATSAGETIGQVSAVQGTVFITHPDGSKTQATDGAPISQGDLIETGANGAVGLTFADDSTFSLADNGSMVIDEMVYDPGAKSGSSAFSVAEGVFTFVSGEIAKTDIDAMTIKTPVATIGIRGTSGGGKAGAEGTNNTFSLFVGADGVTGEMTITTQGGSQTMSIPNQTTQIASAFVPPTIPVVLPPAAVARFYAKAAAVAPTPIITQPTSATGQTGDAGPTGETGGPAADGPTGDLPADGENIEQAAEQAFEQVLAEGGSLEDAMAAAIDGATEADLNAVLAVNPNQFGTSGATIMDNIIDSVLLNVTGGIDPLSAGTGSGPGYAQFTDTVFFDDALAVIEDELQGIADESFGEFFDDAIGGPEEDFFNLFFDDPFSDFTDDFFLVAQSFDDNFFADTFFDPFLDILFDPNFDPVAVFEDDPFFQQLFGDTTVVNPVDAPDLVTKVTANFSGLTVDNSSVFFQGNVNDASATSFLSLNLGSQGAETFSLGTGILVTSGDGTPATSNTTPLLTGGAGLTITDTSLKNRVNTEIGALVSQQVVDATVIKFDFTLSSAEVRGLTFDWMFATEEFPAETFADVAAVYVDGSSVSSLRYDGDNTLVQFRDGAVNFVPTVDRFNENISLSTEYDGITSPDTFVGLINTSLTTHTLEIVVADTADFVGDSALYIASKSLALDAAAGKESNFTSGADVLVGSSAGDTISGNLTNAADEGGNDLIFGAGGGDTITGFTGNDTLYGNDGNDTLNGGDGSDDLRGGAGTDTLNGDAGTDTLTGGGGKDTLNGGTENDIYKYTSASDGSKDAGSGDVIATANLEAGDVFNFSTSAFGDAGLTGTVGLTTVLFNTNEATTLSTLTTAAGTDREGYFLELTGSTLNQALFDLIDTAIAAGSAATGRGFVVVDNGTDTKILFDAAFQTNTQTSNSVRTLSEMTTITGLNDGAGIVSDVDLVIL